MQKIKLFTVLWVIGAVIWAIVACIYFSEGKVGFASIQAALSIGFVTKAFLNYRKHRK